MLMLIKKVLRNLIVFLDFNTSHVNVNLEYPEKGAVDYRISIHLMLMLITSSVRPVPSHIAFQYISC